MRKVLAVFLPVATVRIFLIFPAIYPGQLQAQAPIIETYAGSGGNSDGATATSAILRQVAGLASDTSGNIYIAETGAHRVRKMDRSGTVTTVAGNGVAGFAGDAGPATAARLNAPYGLATDLSGNLYIADLGNSRIRRVGLDGVITTIAGGGTLAPGGTNENALAVTIVLKSPRNIAVTDAGVVYFSDFALHRIFRITTDGKLTTFAGTGVSGYSGDNALATNAKLSFPAGIALDYQGALYIADSQNGAVRLVNQGVISTVLKGVTPTAIALDVTGSVFVADPGAGVLTQYPPGAAKQIFPIAGSALTRASDLNIYASDDAKGLVYRINSAGASSVAAGGGDPAGGDGASAVTAALNHPTAVALDAVGNLFIADRDNNRIRRVNASDGVITTVFSTGLSLPNGISVDSTGNLYIADTGNRRVVKVSTGGALTVLATGDLPVGVAADTAGSVYFADLGAASGVGKIRKIDSAGAVTTVRDGLASPRGLAVSKTALYFTEEDAQRVSKLDLASGTLTRLGAGVFSSPCGLALASNGTLWVSDVGRQQIMLVDSAGKVTVAAGTGSAGFSGDGGAAVNAKLNFPNGLALNSAGDLFIADLENFRIRRVKGIVAPLGPAVDTVSGTLDVLNGASLASGPIAPGMLIELGGTGLKTADLPNTLAFVNSIPVQLLALSPTTGNLQIQAPRSLVSIGTVRISLFLNGTLLSNTDVSAAASAPALFPLSVPAARGSVVALFGTGLGLNDLPVTVSFAGVTGDVVSLDPAPGYPGLFQMNAKIPASAPSGLLDVIVTVGGVASQAGVQVTVN